MNDNLDSQIRSYIASIFDPLDLPLVQFSWPEPSVPNCYMVYLEATERGIGVDQGTSEFNEASGTAAIIRQPWTVIVHIETAADVGSTGLIEASIDEHTEAVRLLADSADSFGVIDGGDYTVVFDAIGWQRLLRSFNGNHASITIEGLLTYYYTVE